MKSYLSRKTLAALAVLLGIITLAWPTFAAPSTAVVLTATKDSYVDLNQADTNFDDQMLLAESTLGAPGQPDVRTRVIFLGFDLSSVNFQIKSAALSLGALTCDGQLPLDSTQIDVHGIDNAPSNAWTESTLTWNNGPLPTTTSLINATSGSVGPMVWNDGAAGPFAGWLESQRTANDGSATLLLRVNVSSGGGFRDVFFEDREGSAAGLGCSDAYGPPTLTLDSEITSFQAFLPIVIR